MVEFTKGELEMIMRLVGNLMSCAVDAGLEPESLESVYCKIINHLET